MVGDGPESQLEKIARIAREKAEKAAKKMEDRARLELAKKGIGKKTLDKLQEDLMGEEEMELANKEEEKKECRWTEEVDKNTGQIYYYHHDTGMAAWDVPEDYDPEQAKALKAKLKAEKRARKEARRKKREEEKAAKQKAALGDGAEY